MNVKREDIGSPNTLRMSVHSIRRVRRNGEEMGMPSGKDECVIHLLAEGAAIDVHGRKEPDGSWSFAGYGGTMDVDDDGNDSVHVEGIRRCKSLSGALPDNAWIRFMPMRVHPELREWFRSRYAAAVAALSEYERQRHDEFRHWKWQALFNSTPPDRWSEGL